MSGEQDSEANTPSSARRFRFPRPRFTLRVFLLVVTCFAAWLGWHIRAAERQKAAVEKLQEFGGWVRYDFQFEDGDFQPKAESWVPPAIIEQLGWDFFHTVQEVNLVYTEDGGGRQDNGNTEPAPLECLKDLPMLTGLYMHDGQATDENLVHVSQLTRLKSFFVWDAAVVSDKGVEHLRTLENLERIHLSDSRITDKSLRVLSKLPKLKKLTLQFNRFTDDGVRELAALKEIESLWVCGRRDRPGAISDDSLEFLFDLEDLQRLGIQNTEVSASFRRRLAKRFPKCRISY